MEAIERSDLILTAVAECIVRVSTRLKQFKKNNFRTVAKPESMKKVAKRSPHLIVNDCRVRVSILWSNTFLMNFKFAYEEGSLED